MTSILKGSAVTPLEFLLVLASDHITAATGLSPTVTISKNGAAFASPAGAVTELANGWYKVAANATDSNTFGTLKLHASVATADPVDRDIWQIVAYDPNDPIAMGLTILNSLSGTSTEGTVSTANNAGSATTFRCSDITTAGAHYYEGKQVWGRTGALAGQWLGVITSYALVSGEGSFTVSPGSPSSSTPANGSKVYIV